MIRLKIVYFAPLLMLLTVAIHGADEGKKDTAAKEQASKDISKTTPSTPTPSSFNSAVHEDKFSAARKAFLEADTSDTHETDSEQEGS